jgi:hypothetical protein
VIACDGVGVQWADHAKLLDRVGTVGGDRSGTWIIATTPDVQALVSSASRKAARWDTPLEIAVSLFETLHAALCLDEMRQSTCIARASGGNADAAAQFLST